MDNNLTIELLRQWDAKVYNDPKYGKEQKLISDFLNKYKYNTDSLIVAAKVSIIDLTNSTQLSKYKSRISLSDLTNIILDIKDFDSRVAKGDEKLVSDIASKSYYFCGEGKGINLFSFASKYCHYHNYCIYGRDDYSIYDSVVGKHLFDYSLKSNPIKKTTTDTWRKEFKYHDFNHYIGEILDFYGIDSSIEGRRRCFDHFLWFNNR